MKPLNSFCLAIASAAIIATPVLAADQQEPAIYAAEVSQLHGEQASVRGDWAEATRLDEQSYRQSPSISNEFNLATDYTHTGQPALAIPLYQDVAEHGGDRTAAAAYNDRTQAAPPRERFNYAEEAVRRLDALTDQPVMQARYYGIH
jgi:hypothetical protein